MLEITYTIKCDCCGSVGDYQKGNHKSIMKAHIMRGILYSDGWYTNNYGMDICPKCRKEGKTIDILKKVTK